MSNFYTFVIIIIVFFLLMSEVINFSDKSPNKKEEITLYILRTLLLISLSFMQYNRLSSLQVDYKYLGLNNETIFFGLSMVILYGINYCLYHIVKGIISRIASFFSFAIEKMIRKIILPVNDNDFLNHWFIRFVFSSLDILRYRSGNMYSGRTLKLLDKIVLTTEIEREKQIQGVFEIVLIIILVLFVLYLLLMGKISLVYIWIFGIIVALFFYVIGIMITLVDDNFNQFKSFVGRVNKNISHS